MTKLIVSAYSALLDVILLVFLLAGAIGAYNLIPDTLFSDGLYAQKNVIKAIVGLFGTFILEVLLVGPFLVLEDIRKSVRIINYRLAAQATNQGRPE